MNINKIDGARRSNIPFARRLGRSALLLAGAALCTPAVGWAVPLLGAAQSFVVLDGSSLTEGGTASNIGDHGASEGKGRSENGGSSAGGNSHRGDAPLSAGAAASAARASFTPPRNEHSGHRDRMVDVIASAVLSIVPCAQDPAGNSLGLSKSTRQGKCVSKTAELSVSDIHNALHDDDAVFVGQIDSGLTLSSLVSSNLDELIGAIIRGPAIMRGVETGDGLKPESGFSSDRPVTAANPALNRPGLITDLQPSPSAPASTVTPLLPAAINVTALPEPSVLALFGLGLMALAGLARRRG